MALPSILHCTLCQDVFTDPVSTPCGHSFCRACLSGFWEGRDMCLCPQCKRNFEGPLDIGVNVVLNRISQQFKKQGTEALQAGIKGEEEESLLPYCAFLCDDEDRSCSTEGLLADTALDLKAHACEKHGRPLELFCRSERACVCVLCAEEDHGGHDAVPVKSEWLHRRAQLRTQVLRVKQRILDRQNKMEEIERQTRLSRESSEQQLEEGLLLLQDLLCSLEERRVELEEAMAERQRAGASRAQGLLQELQQEVGELRTSKAELKQLLRCRDHRSVLQSAPPQPAPPSSRDWGSVVVHADPCVGTVRSVLAPLLENFSAKLRELEDAEFQKCKQYADDVTLDPLTAHCKLAVSKDGRTVHYMDCVQSCDDSPERFDPVSNVLGKQTFRSGRHYWEVQVEGKTAWYLGVVKASIGRKENIVPIPENGLWLLHKKQSVGLRACESPPVELSQGPGLNRVGVYVDYEEGLISFYNAEAKSHMFSFTENTFTEDLCLLLNPQDKIPLIVCPLSD